MTTTSVFEKQLVIAYPYQFDVSLEVGFLAGGVPSDPRKAEAWLRTKVQDNDNAIRKMVAEVMLERGVTGKEATAIIDQAKHLNGFRRMAETGELFIRDYQVAAMLNEAVSVTASAGRIKLKGWGVTNKQIHGFFKEHVAITPLNIGLGVKEPTDVAQRFPTTFRGTGIQYEEFVQDAVVNFRLVTDYDFTETDWAHIWLTGERTVGLGASRGQGFGRYVVTRWDPVALG